jgi:hypothetical protein
MTIKEFIECVNCGGFIDDDGHGYYATKDKMTNKLILPSHITGRTYIFDEKTGKFKTVKIKKYLDKKFSHIVWFNR